MKKILLTGGSGFVGKNIRESFLADKYEISAPSSKELDLSDNLSVQSYFKDTFFDVVFHCASKPAHRNAKDLKDIFEVNMRMFDNLSSLKEKGYFKKFVNFGSGAVFDQSKNISLVKETQIQSFPPEDEYGAYKYKELEFIENEEGFLNLNLFGVFGKYEDWQIRFISNAICKTIFGLPVTLRQNRRFSYLFIDDLMPVLEFFIENETLYKNYNVVPDEPVELFELAQIVRSIANTKTEIIVASKGYGNDYTADNSRLRKEFKDMEFTHLKSAVKKLYDYYTQHKNLIDPELLKFDK